MRWKGSWARIAPRSYNSQHHATEEVVPHGIFSNVNLSHASAVSRAERMKSPMGTVAWPVTSRCVLVSM